MGVSRGKQFEEELKKAFMKDPQLSLDRLPDPMAGYAGIRNICDFVVYKHPYQFYFECKSFKGNTLNFAGSITKDQWNGLNEKSKIPGVAAGIISWFIDHDITVYVPIEELKRIRDAGAKSLNIKDIMDGNVAYTLVPARKKRILFDYDGKMFIDELRKWTFTYQEVREKWQKSKMTQH